MSIQTRAYQDQAVEMLRDGFRQGLKRQILLSPTRSGKTVMGCKLVEGAVAKGYSVLWLAAKRELVHQASSKLWDFGIANSIMMAGAKYEPCNVMVASKDTLWRRDALTRMKFDLIIPDEAHGCGSKTFWAPMEANPQAAVVGLTATPVFPNGRGMGERFERIVKAITYQELRDLGFLVPLKCWAPEPPNLSGLSKNESGEYIRNGAFQSSMNTKQLVGDAVEHWLRWGENQQTVVFATGVQHSMSLVEQFRDRGISAEHVDGETPDDERDDRMARFQRSEFKLLMNVDVCSEGWDCPPVTCCLNARPTGSIRWWRQATCRVLTSHPGKTQAILIDMTGSLYQHGFPDDDIEWPLDADTLVADINSSGTSNNPPVICPQCFAVRKAGKACSECGFTPKPKSRATSTTEMVQGELIPVGREELTKSTAEVERQKVWHQCLGMAANRNLPCSAAMGMFKKRTGGWPDGLVPEITREDRPIGVAIRFPGYVRRRKHVEA